MKQITYEIDIETLNSQKNVKQLEKEVSKLVDEINELNETNVIQKKELQALEARYKSLPKTALQARKILMKDITMLRTAIKENNTALQGFRIQKQQLNKLKTDLKKSEKYFTDTTEQVFKFAKSIGAATSGIILLGGGTEETAKKFEKAGGTLLAVSGVIDAAKNGYKVFNNLVKTNTFLQEANAKINLLAANTMKLFGGSVNTTSFAFKGLRTAIIATGIGALVVGIGLLIANFDKLSKFISNTTKEQDLYNQASKQAIENVADELSASNRLQKILKDESITREDKVEAVKELQKQYPDLLSNVDAEKTSIEDINKALVLNTKLVTLKAKLDAAQQLRSEEYKKILEQQVDAQTGANVGIADHLQSMGSQIQAFFGVEKGIVGTGKAQDYANAKTLASIQTNQKNIKSIDGIILALEKQIDAVKEQGAVDEEEDGKKKVRVDEEKKAAFDLMIAKKEANAEEMINERKKLEEFKEIENLKLQFILDNEKLTRSQILLEKFKTLQAIDKLEKDFEQKSKFRMESRGVQTIETDNKMRESGERLYTTLGNAFTRYMDKQEKGRQEELAVVMQNLERTTDAIMAVQGISDAVFAHKMKNLDRESKEGQKVAEEQFKFNKALQLGLAVVDGAKAVTASLASAPVAIGGVPNPAGIASLAFAITTSAAQVATIAAQKYQPTGTQATTPTVSSPNVATSEPQAPQFNIVGQSGFNQVAQALGQQQPVQAYVVAQDVTTAQQLNNNIISAATVGG